MNSPRSWPSTRLNLLSQIIGLIAILGCIALAIIYIYRYSVNVPYNDDWNYVNQFQEFYKGNLSLVDLITMQDSGYRQPTLRLIWFPLLAFTQINLQSIFSLHMVLIAVSLLGVFLIYRSVFRKSSLLLMFPVALLMFSIGQSEGLLWAGTTPYFLANLGFIFAIALIGKSQKKWFIAGLVSAVAANYSYGNGFLVWPLMALILFSKKASKKRWLIWIVTAVLSVAIYTIGWQMLSKPSLFSHSPSLSEVFRRNPFDVFEFFFSILGMSLNGKRWFGRLFNFQSVAHPAVIGLVLLLVFLGVIIYLVIKGGLLHNMPLIVLFLFGLGNSILLTLGRVGDGEAGAYTTRYVIPTTLAAVGLYLLLLRITEPVKFHEIVPLIFSVTLIWIFISVKIPDANEFGKEWRAKQQANLGGLINFEKLDDQNLSKFGSHYPPAFLKETLSEMRQSHTGLFAK